MEPGRLAGMRFSEAADAWLELHRRHIAPATVRHYHNCFKPLRIFFGDIWLDRIRIGDLEDYQAERSSGSARLNRAGPSRTNHELCTLSQILHRAGLWEAIAPFYKPLRLGRPKTGRALSEDEKRHLFEVASSRPRWNVAYLAALLTVNTTAGPNEIRGLQLCDVDLENDQIHVRLHVKNEYRDRWIPLNQTARWAALQLLERARRCGCRLPTDYLLPHRAHQAGGKWDPTKPVSSWKKAWDNLRTEAACKYPSLATLRLYDLRHTAITELLENPLVSEDTVVALAGWVSSAMKKRYGHIRTGPKREAVAALERDKSRSVSPALASWVSLGGTIAGTVLPQIPAAIPAPAVSGVREAEPTTRQPSGSLSEMPPRITFAPDPPKLRLVKG